jgi:hypothetical protein
MKGNPKYQPARWKLSMRRKGMHMDPLIYIFSSRKPTHGPWSNRDLYKFSTRDMFLLFTVTSSLKLASYVLDDGRRNSSNYHSRAWEDWYRIRGWACRWSLYFFSLIERLISSWYISNVYLCTCYATADNILRFLIFGTTAVRASDMEDVNDLLV